MSRGLRRLLLALGSGMAVLGAAVIALSLRGGGNGLFFAPRQKLDSTELQARLQLPPGFRIQYYAQKVRHARMMRFTSTGDLLVTSPGREGVVYLVEADRDGDGQSDGVSKLVRELHMPNGIDLHDGWLYIGETDRIRRIRYDEQKQRTRGSLETVVPDLPSEDGHWTRTLRFGPDGKLYVTVGSSCNVCEEHDERRAAMLRYDADGSHCELYATGLRNSVGFDFQPQTGDLYATDNGRDLLGDDLPPCELNKIVRGGFYGWPFAYGDRQKDPEMGDGREAEIASSVPPVHGFMAHVAPLGIAFYRGDAWPEPYRRSAYVAQHGSWNRTRKSGYKVVRLEWDEQGAIQESDFIAGFERDEKVSGRPVGVEVGPDGALYVSDDFSGAVYRVTYQPDSQG